MTEFTLSDLPDISQASAGRWIGREPEPLRFTIADLIPANMVTLFASEGGAGKSLLMQLAGSCIPIGRQFVGKDVEPGTAAGVFAEDPEAVLHLRQTRINAALRIDMPALEGRWFPQSYFGMNARLWEDQAPTGFLHDLEHQLAGIDRLRLLALDNAALLYGGNEIDRVEVTAFMSALNGMANRLGIGVLLSTHQSKSTDGSALRVASGSTAWVNAARSVLELKPATDDEPALLRVRKANHAKRAEDIALEWVDGVLLPVAKTDSFAERLRQRELDRLIFEKVRDGWERDDPYSMTAQTGIRYLPKAIAKRTSYRSDEVERAVAEFLENGLLKVDQRLARTPRGLCIVRLPDHLAGLEKAA